MSLPNTPGVRIARAVLADRDAKMKVDPKFQYTLRPFSECIDRMIAAEIEAGTIAPTPKAKKAEKSAVSRWKGAVDDAAWLDELEKHEALRFIDVRRELGKCQLWGKGQGRIISRQRFIQWLLKASPTIGYDAQGKSSTDAKKVKTTAPSGWLAVLRDMYPTAVYFQKGGEFEIKAETEAGWLKIPDAVRLAVEKELAR